MKVLLQRVGRASVSIDGQVVSAIDNGLLALVGITETDDPGVIDQLADKTANLRVFDDHAGVMNLSMLDIVQSGKSASILVVSQFTLYADCRKGRRPSYAKAARPDVAEPLVDRFVSHLHEMGIPVSTGVFAAEMAVELVNLGPVTIMLDSAELYRAV